MEKAQIRAKIILTQMQIVSKNVTGIFKERNELEIKAAKRQTLGITIEQKRENLYAKQLGQRAKRLSLIAKQEQARGTLVAAAEIHEEEKSKKSETNLRNAKNAHELAKKDVEVFNILNVLFKQRLDYQREELDIMERKLSRANNLRLLEKKAHRDELKRRRSETLSAGTVGGLIGRAPEEISSLKNLNKRQRILDQIAIQERRRGDALDAWDDENDKKQNARASELFNLTNIADQAERKVDALKEELVLLDKINQISTQKLLDDQEDVRGRIGGLSISKRATFVNEQMRTLDPEATDEERAAHKAAAEELYNLNLQLENTQSLYDTIDTSMQSAFEGMITGAMSAKEAFATMAQSILKELARIIAQQMILKALQSANNMGLPIPGMRDGGITPKLTGSRYTVGGIARGPSSGYPAILHGNEAVVPLPSGGSIPVQGNIGGGTNNVTVNVTVDSDGNARNDASGEGQGQDLGKVVARAVQEELQYQKRSGGILNPYGAA